MSPNMPDHLVKAHELRVPPPLGQPYSIPLPGTEREGRTPVYRHWRCKDGLLQTLDPKITTAHQMFEQTLARQPKSACLGHRPYDAATKTYGPYVWQDYAGIAERRTNFGVGLVELHRRLGKGGKFGVGLWCQNRPEWQITDLACMSQSLFSVSIYDTLGPEAAEYIINHVGLTCVVTSLAHLPVLLKLKPRLSSLKIIVCLDSLDEGEPAGMSKKALLGSWANDLGVELYAITEVEELGKANPRPLNPPTPEDIITINYTSGTTGNPKGVVLLHRMAVAAASCSQFTVPIQSGDVGCSYLPLAHIYERVGEHSGLWAGAQIGYFHGNILELVDDLKLLRPHGLNSVPRLYNRFGSAIRTATVDQPGVRGAMSRHIVSSKLAALNNPTPGKATNKHALYDRIWSRKVAAAMGLDRTRQMVSGAAPLDPSLHQFLRVVFANNFIQGFGMTETYSVGLGQLVGDYTAGNCGAVAPVMEACLEDVPDMDYLSTDKPYPRGEMLVRGTTLFKEYYRSPEETAKAIDADGWFRTGDIVSIDEMGRFTIIDRRKNVLKLAHGEYISPERIENVYLSNCSWMAVAYVHGEGIHSFLVGLLGVNPEVFAPWAGKILGKTIDPLDVEAVKAACRNEKVRDAACQELEKVGKKNKFNSWEKVKKVELMVDPFTIENELLTPTLKLKRPQTAKKYRGIIDRLYKEGFEDGKGKPIAKL